VVLAEDRLAGGQDLSLEAVVLVEGRGRLDLPQGQTAHLGHAVAHHPGHGLVGRHQPGLTVEDRHRHGQLREREVPQGLRVRFDGPGHVLRGGGGHQPRPRAVAVREWCPLQPYDDPAAAPVPQRDLGGPAPALGHMPARGLGQIGGEQPGRRPAHDVFGLVSEQPTRPGAPHRDRPAGVDDDRQVLGYASLHGASGCAAPAVHAPSVVPRGSPLKRRQEPHGGSAVSSRSLARWGGSGERKGATARCLPPVRPPSRPLDFGGIRQGA
jgi:hypothetical protein